MKMEDIKLSDLPNSPGARLVVIVGSIVISAVVTTGAGILWSAWAARGVYDALQEQQHAAASDQDAIAKRLGAVEDAARRTDAHVGAISNDISFIAGQLRITLPGRRGEIVPGDAERGEIARPDLPPG